MTTTNILFIDLPGEDEDPTPEQLREASRHFKNLQVPDAPPPVVEPVMTKQPVLVFPFDGQDFTPMEHRINALFHDLSPAFRAFFQTAYYTTFECVNCKENFREYANLSRWQCQQHACGFDLYKHVWPCCQQNFIEAEGCIACDHTPTTASNRYTDDDTIYMPRHVADKFVSLFPDMIIQSLHPTDIRNTQEGANTTAVLSRYDREATMALYRALGLRC